MKEAPLIVLVAGGTGGHLFPAEALASCLMARGYRVELMTDARAQALTTLFPPHAVHVIASATPVARGLWHKAKAFFMLGRGFLQAKKLLRHLKPVCVVGFGGYPTVPPLVAAASLKIPSILHEQNAVLGRANRFLASSVDAIATCFAQVHGAKPAQQQKMTLTGNPLRPKVLAAMAPYAGPVAGGPMRVLVTGGSLGARIMSETPPAAMARLEEPLRRRLHVIHQARAEDMDACRAIYDKAGITVELAPFFKDLPAHMSHAHLVIGRAGASTVAELAALGRPSLLVPYPGAIDQDQAANAAFLAQAGGAELVVQTDFTPDWLAAWFNARFAEIDAGGTKLARAAEAAKMLGITDAAERLAALVLSVAKQKDTETR